MKLETENFGGVRDYIWDYDWALFPMSAIGHSGGFYDVILDFSSLKNLIL